MHLTISGNFRVTTSLNSLGGNGSGTMDFWIKIPSPITTDQYIVGIANLFEVRTDPHGQVSFIPTVNTATGPGGPVAPFIFPAGIEFHHIAVVYDSSIARGIVYLDGQQVTQTASLPSGTKLVPLGQGNLTIGNIFHRRSSIPRLDR